MKIRYYKPAIACATLLGKAPYSSSGNATVIPFKSVDGTERDKLFNAYSTPSEHIVRLFAGDYNVSSMPDRSLNPFFSTEVLSDFDPDEFSKTTDDIINSNLTFTKSKLESLTFTEYVYTITNVTDGPITINSIKFTKNLAFYLSSWNYFESLMYVVYLDDSVTIQPGETDYVTVRFTFLPQYSE